MLEVAEVDPAATLDAAEWIGVHEVVLVEAVARLLAVVVLAVVVLVVVVLAALLFSSASLIKRFFSEVILCV